jgi:hypothetical protein
MHYILYIIFYFKLIFKPKKYSHIYIYYIINKPLNLFKILPFYNFISFIKNVKIMTKNYKWTIKIKIHDNDIIISKLNYKKHFFVLTN